MLPQLNGTDGFFGAVLEKVKPESKRKASKAEEETASEVPTLEQKKEAPTEAAASAEAAQTDQLPKRRRKRCPKRQKNRQKPKFRKTKTRGLEMFKIASFFAFFRQ